MKRIVLLASALLTIGAVRAAADPAFVPPLDVPAMVAASDVIAVGRAGDLRAQNSRTGPTQTFVVFVDRVLKGAAVGPTRRIPVTMDLSRPDFGVISDRRYGVFFLKRTTPGKSYAVVDPYRPALVASPASEQTAAVAGDALTAVTEELGRVLASSAATLTDRFTGVERFGSMAAAREVEDLDYRAAAALETIPYETAGATLRAIAASDRMPGRLWAIKALLVMGDEDALETEKVRYLDSIKATLISPPADLAFTAYVLGMSMEGRLKSPQAVPTLGALLASHEVTVRRAAASLLADIGTSEATAHLSKSALHDEDQDVRYYAVSGLARASGIANLPTTVMFKRNEGAMVDFWATRTRTNVR